MTMPQFKALILGHIAISLWFIPYISLKLHRLRGVRFKNIKKVFIGRSVFIDNKYPELIEIGEDVWITSNCTILSHSSTSNIQTKYGFEEKIGKVTIGDGVFIGTGTIICPSVNVGKGAYIGAGSVVTKNVSEYCVVAGNPAILVRNLTKS